MTQINQGKFIPITILKDSVQKILTMLNTSQIFSSERMTLFAVKEVHASQWKDGIYF